MKLDQDPIAQFAAWQRTARGELPPRANLGQRMRRWFSRILRRIFVWLLKGDDIPEANAATLATADAAGVPSARMVLVKEASPEGFYFYTNYGSRKAAELDANPHAALVFHWAYPPRQVRVEGEVVKLDQEQSEAYWRTRPRGSQLGAMASHQSEPLAAGEQLGDRVAAMREGYRDRDIPCPSFWGGYRIVPRRIEFWEGRASRLHERVVYERDAGDGEWRTHDLQP